MLGVVSAFHPSWVADAMRWIVALVAAPVLFWAVTTAMLGVSRHIYTLAINRQIPSWLGKLNARHATPHVAIAISGADRDRPRRPDQRQAAGRASTPSARPWRSRSPSSRSCACGSPSPTARAPSGCRWNVDWRGAELPVPAMLAALLSGLAFLSVLAFHDTARWVGGGWMAFGLLFYVVYRKVFEGTTLTKRVSVTERALTKQVPRGRLPQHPRARSSAPSSTTTSSPPPAASPPPSRRRRTAAASEARLDLVYVIEVPLTLPLDAELPPEREEEARRALERASEVGEEYEDVEVSAEVVRAREVGAGIVEAARRSGAEAIVVGAEPPSQDPGRRRCSAGSAPRSRPRSAPRPSTC